MDQRHTNYYPQTKYLPLFLHLFFLNLPYYFFGGDGGQNSSKQNAIIPFEALVETTKRLPPPLQSRIPHFHTAHSNTTPCLAPKRFHQFLFCHPKNRMLRQNWGIA